MEKDGRFERETLEGWKGRREEGKKGRREEEEREESYKKKSRY